MVEINQKTKKIKIIIKQNIDYLKTLTRLQKCMVKLITRQGKTPNKQNMQ